MLDNFKNTIEALGKFDFGNELEVIVVENKEAIADLQAKQLAKGKNVKGEDINPPYKPFTIAMKRKYGVGLGRITDHVTFFSSGELYKSLFAEVAGRMFEIKSGSFKFGKMIKRSGQNTVGLNYDSRLQFGEEITMPGIRKVFKAKTGLVIS